MVEFAWLEVFDGISNGVCAWFSVVVEVVLLKFPPVEVVGESVVLLAFVAVGVKGPPSLPGAASFVRFFLRKPSVGIKSAFGFLSRDTGCQCGVGMRAGNGLRQEQLPARLAWIEKGRPDLRFRGGETGEKHF